MKIAMRVALSGGLAAALLMATGVATAQVRASMPDDGYGYQLDVDLLDAGGSGSMDAASRDHRHPARVSLLRLRFSFVPEILRSVSHL